MKRIAREFKFKDFRQALNFTVSVGELAEREGHHPDVHLSWGRVVAETWTHKIKGLHQNDFILAAKTDDLCAARKSWRARAGANYAGQSLARNSLAKSR